MRRRRREAGGGGHNSEYNVYNFFTLQIPAARTLRHAPDRSTHHPRREKSRRALLYSYVDDFNPLIVTYNLSLAEHDSYVAEVDRVMEETAAEEHLSWDPSKEARVDFGRLLRSNCKTLGLLVNSSLDFTAHIADRVRKAKGCLAVLNRISNSHSGITPKAARALYTGCIRPILTYGAETRHAQGDRTK